MCTLQHFICINLLKFNVHTQPYVYDDDDGEDSMHMLQETRLNSKAKNKNYSGHIRCLTVLNLDHKRLERQQHGIKKI
jgi:hypothetical protein